MIRNTYRTLMTRGQKGCYVFCEDKALGAYLKSEMQRNIYLQEELEEYFKVAEGRTEYGAK